MRTGRAGQQARPAVWFDVAGSFAAHGLVNEREVANLPLNGRQLSQLYLLAPGAQTAGGGSFDNIRFSGRANQQNAIRFDGVEAPRSSTPRRAT